MTNPSKECAEKAPEEKIVAECGEGSAWRRVRPTPVTRNRVGLEVLSKSCTDLKVCGTRAELKQRLEKCASTLTSICEHSDEKDEDEIDDLVNDNDQPDSTKQDLQKDARRPKYVCDQATGTPSPTDLISFERDLAEPLLPRALVQPGMNLNLGPFHGDVEIAVRTEKRVDLFALTHSPANLNEPPMITRTALTPSLAMTQKFQLQLENAAAYLTPLDFQELPVLTSKSTQTVDEVEMGCQVGGSLIELNETDSESFVPTAMEPIQEGLVYSYEALKHLIRPLFEDPAERADPEQDAQLLAEITHENESDKSACSITSLPTTSDSLAVIDQLLLYTDL